MAIIYGKIGGYRTIPIPEVHFALFYVNDELYYIVPFSLADKHYVEEILNYDTVPKFRRMFGKWVKKKSEGLLEYYVAEYSEYEEPKEKKPPSRDWTVAGLADHLYNNGSNILLEKLTIDLFETSFSEVSGLTKSNLGSQRSLAFLNWLIRENVEYRNRVTSCYVKETSKEGLKVYLSGKFTVIYDENAADALDFLQEYDIMFSDEAFIDGTWGAQLVKQLQSSMEIDSIDE